MTQEQPTEDSTSNLLPSSTTMKRRRRSRWHKGFAMLLTPRSAVCLTSTCLLSCFCFAAVLYLNFSAVRLLLDNSEPAGQSSLQNLIRIAPFAPKRTLSADDRRITYKDFNYLKPASLTYTQKNYSKEIPILYRFPTQRDTRAILLIFHGCGRSAHDWFHTIERQRIIGAAIDLGFACLAFQATDQIRRCWSSEMDLTGNQDIQMVNQGMEGFFKEHPKLGNAGRTLASFHQKKTKLKIFWFRISPTIHVWCIEWRNIFQYICNQLALFNSRTDFVYLNYSSRSARWIYSKEQISSNCLDSRT